MDRKGADIRISRDGLPTLDFPPLGQLLLRGTSLNTSRYIEDKFAFPAVESMTG